MAEKNTKKRTWNGCYNSFHCPECGKFVGNVRATLGGIACAVTEVVADCKNHGRVDVMDQGWSYEMFVKPGSGLDQDIRYEYGEDAYMY